MSPLRFGNNRGAKQKHGSNFGVRALVAKHCGRKGAFLGTAARSFGVLLAAVLDGARLLCSCAWSEADYDSGANFALSMWRGDAAGAHLPSTQEYIVPINVPEPDVAVPLVALAGLIVMMTTDTPENLTQCPLCEVQAGFHASHCWAYGPVVVFHLVRKHARSARVALDRSLSLDGRSYKLRACVCHRGETNSGQYMLPLFSKLRRINGCGTMTPTSRSDCTSRLNETHSAYAIYEVELPDVDLAGLSTAFCQPFAGADEATLILFVLSPSCFVFRFPLLLPGPS